MKRNMTSWLRSVGLLCAIIGFAAVAEAQLFGIDVTGDLYTISTTDASISRVGSTGITDIGSLEYRLENGLLYGFSLRTSATLYSIDPSNAQTVSIGPLNTGFVFEGGLAITPDGGAIGTNRGSSGTPSLFSIDLDTGVATAGAVVSGAPHDLNGLGVRSDGRLVGLDRETNSLLLINVLSGQSSNLAVVAATIGARGGISLVDGQGYYTTGGLGDTIPGSNELYAFDPFTGSQTLVGGFPSGISFSGLAWIPVPEPSSGGLLGLVVGWGLVARRPE